MTGRHLGTAVGKMTPAARVQWRSFVCGNIEIADIQWRAIRDEYRNFLMSQECAEMAQMIANLE